MDALQLALKASRGDTLPVKCDLSYDRKTPIANVREVMDEVLCSSLPGSGLDILRESGVLTQYMPEVVAMYALGDGEGLHKDVWAHTQAVVASVPARLELRWSALFHDIGKATTRVVDKKGRVTFHMHEVHSARMMDSIQRRWKCFDQALFDSTRALVFNHLRPASYKDSWTDSGVRRLIADLGDEGFANLMYLSRADLTTKQPAKRRQAAKRANELEARVKAVIEADRAPRLPKGAMGLILDASGLPPGKWLSPIKDRLELDIREGRLPADAHIDTYVQAGLAIMKECQ